MELIWLAIIPAILSVIGGIVAGLRARAMRQKELKLETYIGEVYTGQVKLDVLPDLKETLQRLEELERGKAAETIGEEVLSELSERLNKVEEAIEPFKERREFTSAEFHMLLHEIERARQDLDSRQATFERRNTQSFSSFTSRMSFWMIVMSILFAIAIALLIYLLPK